MNLPASATKQIELTPEQNEALGQIMAWYRLAQGLIEVSDSTITPQFKLGGYAGTGKSTLIRYLLREPGISSVSIAAFTGKAAHVLQRKGMDACTIHSLIYRADVDPKTHETRFVLKDKYDLHCRLIIIDEASMVSTQLYADLLSFGIPILFVGDPGQLEPVGDNPNLMREPNFTLQTIHRQALESPIIGLATAIRTGGPGYAPPKFGSHGEDLKFINKNLPAELIHGVDQIICARNNTRQRVNERVRSDKGYRRYSRPEAGERLICLRNNRELNVFNGMMMTVVEVVVEKTQYYEMIVQVDGSASPRTLLVWVEPFVRDVTDDDRVPKLYAYCDFAYCITCHKSQGSEWDKVLVVDEPMGRVWDMTRWRYTAVTRASKQLYYAI